MNELEIQKTKQLKDEAQKELLANKGVSELLQKHGGKITKINILKNVL